MSILEFINKQLRRIKIVKDYQGINTKHVGTIEHIGTSTIYSLLVILIATLNPWLLLLELPVWGLYSLFKELVLDRKKNQGQPSWGTWAQVLERSSGFVVTIPFYVLVFY